MLEGTKHVTYGFVIYQGSTKIHTGQGALHQDSHVFDAEAVGAWEGLRTAMNNPQLCQQKIWLCIDSTSVIWCLRGNASQTSQWAFLRAQEVIDTWNVHVKWCPGHTDIQGNKEADQLADNEAHSPTTYHTTACRPTISGICSLARKLLRSAEQEWWLDKKQKLSAWYQQWDLPYTVREPEALSLKRTTLARLLAIRTTHGDFAWYHKKFNHIGAKLVCSCKRHKTPDHLVHCAKVRRLFHRWPLRPDEPPATPEEGRKYLNSLLRSPQDFAAFLRLTKFYTDICTH